MSTPAPDVPRTAALPHRTALHVAAAVSTYDRFVVVPLLLLLAVAFDRPVGELVALAVGHQVAYGLSQPVWGALSDRFGRVRVIRVALAGGAAASVLSVLAQDVGLLLVVRVLAGGLFGAVVPTVMALVADRVEPERRRAELSGLMRSIAVGTATATAASGLVGEFLGWRWAFAVPAVLALGALWGLRRVVPPAGRRTVALRESLPGLVRPTVVLVLLLVLLEGALVLGGLQVLPTALQDAGSGAGVAGVVTAVFGVGVVVAAGVVSRLGSHVPLSATASIGALALVGAGGVVVPAVNAFTVGAACLLLAVAWAFLHNALQTWISEVPVPGRGLVVSSFAGCLFLGSALGVWAAAGWMEAGEWRLLFGTGTGLAIVLGAATVLLRLRAETQAGPVP